MKIVLVKYGGFPSQGDTELYEIATGLQELGNIVWVLVPRHINEPFFEDRGNLRIIRVHTIRHIPPLINLLFFHLKSSILIRRLQPDVVEATNSLSVSILKLASIKGSSANWLFYVTTGAIKKGVSSTILNAISELEANFFDKIVITESHQKRFFRNTAPWKLHLVPYGVNLNLFQPRSCLGALNQRRTADEVWFVYQGSMARIRSIDILIQAFKEAYTISPSARLLLVGPIEPYVLDAIEKSGCKSAIRFTGAVPYPLMPKILGCCDVGLSWVPNIDALTFNPPFKAMEFLACGLPVLATNTFGNKLFVKDGLNGIITENEPKSYGRAMSFLCSNKSARERLAANSRSSIKNYGWETVINSKLVPILIKS